MEKVLMEIKRYKPKFDKVFYIPMGITAVLMLGITVFFAIAYPVVLFSMLPCDLLVGYFVASSAVGYVELRESVVFVKFGFFLKKEIPYNKIRRVEKQKHWYSESIVALKNAMEHVDIRYNTYDVTTVSVVDNDDLIAEIDRRRGVSE